MNYCGALKTGNLLNLYDSTKRTTLESGQIVDRVLTTVNAHPWKKGIKSECPTMRLLICRSEFALPDSGPSLRKAYNCSLSPT